MDHSFTPSHRIWGRVTQKTIPVLGTDAALGAGGSGDASYNPLMGSFTNGSDLTNIGGQLVQQAGPRTIQMMLRLQF